MAKYNLNKPIERIPEKQGQYAKQGVDVYQNEMHGGIVGRIRRSFVEYVLSCMPDKKACRVLDLGTGPGWIGIAIAEARPDTTVTGLDASPIMLNQARENAARQGVNVMARGIC